VPRCCKGRLPRSEVVRVARGLRWCRCHSLERQELELKVGDSVEYTAKVRLIEDVPRDDFPIAFGTDIHRVDEVGEPTNLSSANDEAIGLLTAHGRIVSLVGRPSLARRGDHPGESSSSPRLVACSTASLREVASSLR
jgi:hypothetical protein